tara:strand:- start:2529 stop:4064 length:1536 start_codon:yes stop_codon:yes gene_type:complete
MIESNTSNALCDKWAPILEGIEDSYTRETTAVLLENQARHVLNEQAKNGVLNEETAVGDLGTFQKFAFPLVRRVFPELIANKVISVQPMQGPVSQVFYLGYDRLGNDPTDGLARGAQTVYGKYDLTYAANAIGEAGGQGNIGDLDALIHAAPEGVQASGVSGTMDNATVGQSIAAWPASGSTSQFHTSAGEALTGAGIPEINFHIEQQAVVAKTRKFRALWTIEASQDLKAYHNLDLERELTDLLGKEVALEIDRELLEDLRSLAYDADGAEGLFDRAMLDLGNSNKFPAEAHAGAGGEGLDGNYQYGFTAGTNPIGTDKNVFFVDFNTSALGMAPRHAGEAYANLVAVVNMAAQDIYKSTYRGAGNFICTSPLVAAMIQSSAKLEGGMPADAAGSMGANIQFKGKWMGQYDVYVDPLWPEDEILIGYKGPNAMEGGLVYAPYIPLQMLPTVVDPDTFQPRKGLITRYGKAAVSPESRFYRMIRIVGAQSSRYLFQPGARIDNGFGESAIE